MNLMDFDPRSGGTLKCCEAYGGGRRCHRLPLRTTAHWGASSLPACHHCYVMETRSRELGLVNRENLP
jgi:hypothetical protein